MISGGDALSLCSRAKHILAHVCDCLVTPANICSSEGLLARVLSGGSHEGALKEHEILGLVSDDGACSFS
jgi:hypothetical protein